jgi:TatA/E family protein of Tat protein translocase
LNNPGASNAALYGERFDGGRGLVFTGLESPIHLIIVLVVVLLFFGAKRVPELAKGLGEGVREFRKGTQGEGAEDGEEDALEAPDDREGNPDPR